MTGTSRTATPGGSPLEETAAREMRSHAQFREDVNVLEFFGKGYRGRVVDVGANDGVEGSNSRLLELHGWVGLLVEPSPKLAAACRRSRPRSVIVNKAAVAHV